MKKATNERRLTCSISGYVVSHPRSWSLSWLLIAALFTLSAACAGKADISDWNGPEEAYGKFSGHADIGDTADSSNSLTLLPDGETDLTTYVSDAAMRDRFRAQFSPTRFDRYATWVNQALVDHPELGKIPIEDLVAVIGYTADATEDYPTPDYWAINKALRAQDSEILAEFAPYIRCASSGLNQLEAFVGTVFRGTTLPPEILAVYVAGQSMKERAFTSTSVDILPEFKGNTEFVIASMRGRPVWTLSEFPNEKEVVFVPGTRFQVVNVSTDERAQQTTVMMQELQ
jgi:hypothetical protein